jgi:hypothetical protein
MPDIYASITAADPATLERLIGALELRAADLLRRAYSTSSSPRSPFPNKQRHLKSAAAPER